jgi:hypothetical protein
LPLVPPTRRDRPAVAVVIPTYRRQSLLPGVIAAAAAQQVDGGVEVIVVDDEPSDETRQIVERAARDAPSTVRYLTTATGGRGPARARNTGWRAADAPLIAFTDDDCLPRPGWLASLVDALREHDIAQGVIRRNPTQHDRGRPFTRSLEAGGSPFFETANIAYRRSVLEDLGGFDESFPMAAGEDTDLGHRAMARGARVVRAPGAEVWHEVHPLTVRGAFDNALRCDQLIRVVVRYPDLVQYFRTPLLLLPHHPKTLGAATGSILGVIGVARRRPVLVLAGAAAAAPWLQLRGRRAPVVESRGRRVATLPVQLAVELVEMAVVVRAAVRYRLLGRD